MDGINPPRTRLGLAADARGVTTVEYVLALGLFTAGLVAPLIALSVALARLFNFQQALLLFPAP
jgi:Flp pilus assembly pilin Flp